MCVIVNYACQNCKQETGQRDYVRHTDGQRFPIPDPKMEIVSFCTELIPLRVIVHKPSVQSVDFPCENPDCAGMKVHYDKDEYDDEEGRIVGLLGGTAEIVAEEGRSDNDVKEMLQQMGIDQSDMEELSDATIEKWTGLAEDKLKQMAVNGDTIQDVKKVLQATTGFKYTNYMVFTKAATFGIRRNRFGAGPANADECKPM
ncbi:hypothetical protein N8I77_004932 [Diaporthe amygdali]|uniref:Uncharacterized protein n=1 Tax=Phomopsis amygdali TaxID=1214568 RepID=A0AAD9SN44_PHOAM|nr:hypothetical protein N8I77_004932 [Diaporthe amygdali]